MAQSMNDLHGHRRGALDNTNVQPSMYRGGLVFFSRLEQPPIASEMAPKLEARRAGLLVEHTATVIAVIARQTECEREDGVKER